MVLLDDSLSMSVKNGSESALQNAKAALSDFVLGLSNNGSRDQLTLYLTSDPTHPVFNGEEIDSQKAAEIVAEIEQRILPSDRPANLNNALLEVEKGLDGPTASKLNQVVYVISDMRQGDWPAEEEATDEQGVTATLRRIASASSGCFLVDIGREDDVGNVFVEEVVCKEKALVAGVPSDFEVTVRNAGKREAKNVKVQFVAGFQDGGEIPPIEETIESLPPGTSQTVPFKFAFSREELEESELGSEPARIRATVVPASEDLDELPDDNARFFAARVAPGLKTLIVDGDRLPSRRDSESFFLAHALSPPGDQLSGMAVDVVGESEFENLRLEDYQVIYLCNLYRIPETGGQVADFDASADADEETDATETTTSPAANSSDGQQLSRLQQLERWVANGGGLVISMGNRIDDLVYNRELYRNGEGLLPVQLDDILGAVDESSWVKFNVEQPHPVMSLFADSDSPFVELVKIFRWWDCTISESDLQEGRVNVVARFTNPEGSPAVVEKKFGQGRVFLFTTALDRDWSDWPQDHSYVPTMLELNKYMARQTSDDANMLVGDALEQDLDLSRYELQFQVTSPDDATTDAQAVPPQDQTEDQLFYDAKFDEVDRKGFYQMVFNRREAAGPVPMLFAANIEAAEGDLTRADVQGLQRKLGDAKVSFISADDLLKINVDDARIHLWPFVLALLVGVLALEQFLGWRFGRSR